MTSDVSVAVIIAAHNEERYLPETLDSLRKQTLGMENLEIILIDDASTDATLTIFKDFQKEAPHCVVEHVEYRNIGKVRNVGIDKATAPFLLFLDGDDLLAPNACEQMLETLHSTHCDMVMTPLYRFSEKDGSIDFTKAQIGTVTIETSKKIWEMLLEHRKVMGHLIGRLFSRHLFSSLRFPPMLCYEDVYLFPDILEKTEKVAIYDAPLYFYRLRQGSVSSTLTNDKACLMFDVLEKFRTRVSSEKQRRLFEAMCVGRCAIMSDHVADLSDENRERIRALISAIPVWKYLISPTVRTSRKRLFLRLKRAFQA
ncbi:MAG: glycosyltransferase [Burkholderiales bacterium]|jgi:glycosyltransferase involved in cell wall biosynthesis|nr:glycosyltransferase [Burkholderiales bacterium]